MRCGCDRNCFHLARLGEKFRRIVLVSFICVGQFYVVWMLAFQ